MRHHGRRNTDGRHDRCLLRGSSRCHLLQSYRVRQRRVSINHPLLSHTKPDSTCFSSRFDGYTLDTSSTWTFVASNSNAGLSLTPPPLLRQTLLSDRTLLWFHQTHIRNPPKQSPHLFRSRHLNASTTHFSLQLRPPHKMITVPANFLLRSSLRLDAQLRQLLFHPRTFAL